ncbi:MAG: hypothetical protein V3G42_04145 [Oscillospiraceae bacterium]
MKKYLSTVLLGTMCLLSVAILTGCGEDTDNNTNVNESSSITTTATTILNTTTVTKQTTKKETEKYTPVEEKKTEKYTPVKEADDELSAGEYWCMGKNDTCKNKTYSPSDLYCHSCDPDDNNIEGDQSKSYGAGGEVIDNDYDGDIDNDDWEKAWGDYLDDKYDDYGY